ncbi:MAG: hypothetical protein AAFX58_11530 [Pseudomonadota bacterium]
MRTSTNRSARLPAAACMALLAACAAPPSAEQYLDMRTGATIFRVSEPLLLYRRVAGLTDRTATEFALLAPFEVNRAGDYRLYLWLEVADYSLDDESLRSSMSEIELTVDGAAHRLALATFERREIGIGEHVYERHSGWGQSGYYRIDAALLTALATAGVIQVAVVPESPPYELASPDPARGQAMLTMRELAVNPR